MKDPLPKFQIGQIVYHKADNARCVVIAIINFGTHLQYKVDTGVKNSAYSDRYEAELSEDPVLIISGE